MKPPKRRRVVPSKWKEVVEVAPRRKQTRKIGQGRNTNGYLKDNPSCSDKQRPGPSSAVAVRPLNLEEDVGRSGGRGGSESLLIWNTKAEHLSDQLLQLYRLGDNQMTLTDVTLCSCEGQFVQAHKLVLSLCSQFFRRLFVQASQTNNSNAVIVLGNVKLQHLRYLLMFIYTGEVNVPANDLEDFLKAGESLQIEGLRGYIKTFANTTVRGEQTEASDNPPPEDPPLSPESEVAEVLIPISEARILRSSKNRNPQKGTVEEEEIDDSGSNYSEDDMSVELADASVVSDDGVDKGKDKKNVGKGRRLEWSPIQITENEIKENWRIRGKMASGNAIRKVQYFYCAQSTKKRGFKKCGAQLKIEVFMGKTTYFSNNNPHSNHRTSTHGLTEKQKALVNKLLGMGVQKPVDLMKAIKMENPELLPTKSKISCYLRVARQNGVIPRKRPTAKASDGVRKSSSISKPTGNPRGRLLKYGRPCAANKSSNIAGKFKQANETPAKRNPVIAHKSLFSHSKARALPHAHHQHVQHTKLRNPQYRGFQNGHSGMIPSAGGGGGPIMNCYHFANNSVF